MESGVQVALAELQEHRQRVSPWGAVVVCACLWPAAKKKELGTARRAVFGPHTVEATKETCCVAKAMENVVNVPVANLQHYRHMVEPWVVVVVSAGWKWPGTARRAVLGPKVWTSTKKTVERIGEGHRQSAAHGSVYWFEKATGKKGVGERKERAARQSVAQSAAPRQRERQARSVEGRLEKKSLRSTLLVQLVMAACEEVLKSSVRPMGLSASISIQPLGGGAERRSAPLLS